MKIKQVYGGESFSTVYGGIWHVFFLEEIRMKRVACWWNIYVATRIDGERDQEKGTHEKGCKFSCCLCD